MGLHMSITPDQIRSMRLGMNLTQAEAAAIAKVSPRTWAAWEGGSRHMPYSALDLFTLRITHSVLELESKGIPIKDEVRSVVTFVAEGANQDLIPVDVIAKDNFLDVKVDSEDKEKRIVSSLAVNAKGKPYVHRTSVSRMLNVKQLETVKRWKEEIDSKV